MRLIDEEEIENQKVKNRKRKKIIIIAIICLLILCGIIVGAIVYKTNNPTQITTYIDGKLVQNFDAILDFQVDEKGETQIYIPIREFASYLNAINKEFEYQTFKGDYNPKTEEEDKCYVIRDGYEVALYTKGSKTIYKLNLQRNRSGEYDECYIDQNIFESNGKLYASIDGIEKGYNIMFSYDENKKIIRIYTLDYLIQTHQAALENQTIGSYGTLEIVNNYADWKSIFEGLLIVKSSNRGYGIINTSDYTSFVLEPQYDEISFISSSSTFLVKSNSKIGLFSKDGKRKINLIYDEITSMGQDSNLYKVTSNRMEGVVDEDGNIIIYPEYDQVGITVSSFSYNGVKNGYIILNTLIPVLQDDKWAFFDKNGNMLTNGFIYETIGCTSIKSGNNIYPLLEIPEYNVIVVGDEYGKYSFMNLTGDDTMLPFVFDNIYIKLSGGEISYWMIYREKEYEVLNYLQQLK